MKKKILFGSLLAVVLMMLVPSIPAVEYTSAVQAHETYVVEQLQTIEETPLIKLAHVLDKEGALQHFLDEQSAHPQCVSWILSLILTILLNILFIPLGLTVSIIVRLLFLPLNLLLLPLKLILLPLKILMIPIKLMLIPVKLVMRILFLPFKILDFINTILPPY